MSYYNMCIQRVLVICKSSNQLEITRLSKAAWFKIITKDSVVHIDPGYTGYFKNQGIPLEALEQKANLILISHFHKDHLQPEALERICTEETRIIAPKSCAGKIKQPFLGVEPGDEISAAETNIKVVDAYNTPDGHSTRKVHHKGVFAGYTIAWKAKQYTLPVIRIAFLKCKNWVRSILRFCPSEAPL
jgi:L-ascorbate metabolism protein UlaG (beta-lactamase superfamily)